MSDRARSPHTDGEQGSDRVADRAPPSPIDDVRQLQRAIGNRALARLLAREPAPPEVERAVRTPGSEIPARVRASFEAAFGRDFSAVRVHTGREARAAARAVDASAFAVGGHIVVGDDGAIGTRAALPALAHELAHVAQQPPGSPGALTLGPRDDGAEREAEHAAHSVPASLVGAASGELSRSQRLARLHVFAASHDRGALAGWRERLGEPVVTRHRTPLGEVRRMGRASKEDVPNAAPQQDAGQPAATTDAGTSGAPAPTPSTGPSAARVREWPSAVPAAGAPRPADLDDAKSELSQIVATVQANRDAVAEVIKDTWQRPALKSEVGSKTKTTMTAEQVQALTPAEQRQKFVSNRLGGYMKTASSDARQPASFAAHGNVAETDRPRVAAINQAIWEELGHEGDPGSINTYDNAILTWGQGWAASGGRLSQLMTHLPPAIRDRLLDLGFTYNKTWLYLDTTVKLVRSGDDALQHVRFDTKLLSAMYAVGHGPDAQGLIEAQAGVMFDTFDTMPKAIRDLDDRLIMVIVHCCWWGHMTMGQASTLVSGLTALADQLQAVVRWQAAQGGCHTGSSHGATLVEGWQATLFNTMGRHVIRDTFAERADEPTDDHNGKTLIKPPSTKQYIVV